MPVHSKHIYVYILERVSYYTGIEEKTWCYNRLSCTSQLIIILTLHA